MAEACCSWRGRWQAGRLARHGRSDQADARARPLPPCASEASTSSWRPATAATTAEAVAAPGHRRRARRSAARGQGAPGGGAAGGEAARSPWPATASTMRRRWPQPTSASPWARAPTWRWRARAHPGQGRPRGIARARRWPRPRSPTSGRTWLSLSSTTRLGVPVAAGVLYPDHRRAAVADDRGAAMSLSSVSVVGNALRLGAIRISRD